HPRRGRWSRCRLLGGNPRRQTVPDAFDPAAVMTVVDQHPHNDPADQHYQRAVAAAHQKLTDAIVDTAQVRSPVSESWRRCLELHNTPETVTAPATITSQTLAEHRKTHPIAAVLPMLQTLLAPAHD